MAQFDIVTIGDIVQDIFIWPEKNITAGDFCFVKGSKTKVARLETGLGGCAANVVVGLARLGLKTAIISILNDDAWAEKARRILAQGGVGDNLIKKDVRCQDSIGIIMMSEGGERTILIHHGLDDYSQLKIPANFKSNWLYVSSLGDNWQKVYDRIIPLASEKGTQIAVNPGGQELREPAGLKRLLRVSRVVFVNEVEAKLLTGSSKSRPIREVVKDLLLTGVELAVLTCGSRGAYAMSQNDKEIHFQAADNVQMVDATGAGDGFASGFLAALLSEKTAISQPFSQPLIKKALIWGSKNAASVVQKVTAQAGLLHRSTLNAHSS
ncbi:MAG: PfkB domain-containing protein [Candidatus Berkelbacteria bacterium Licking1014_2]|uniref:PfkB domain-containing protein n=1 Tax=Candidatus Berkelbacteria bacterium Licking1014_2 TaxID=2017146 RepID=A0A554LXA2_9BACT|nr:MAG: PfkB domain-containing protein [Candidatus Berkelbacteria bacterium Licking1014_2]